MLTELPKTLRLAEENEKWYARKKKGKRYSYFSFKGEEIQNEKELQRIKDLVIPPMWKSVLVNPDAKGHLQAVGFDARGRKQYLYHPEYYEFANQKKFARLLELGNSLTLIRRETDELLRKRKWTKEKVLALAVRILDETSMRVGNKSYEKINQTYGLTTLRRKHLEVNDDCVIFSYKGKSNKYQTISLVNKQLCRLVKACSELPGYELFRYQTEDGSYATINSGDINAFLKELSGKPITAKDFRTWGGTRSLLENFKEAKNIVEEHPRKKFETVLMRLVSASLGNTIATCREYYVHPAVLSIVLKSDPEKIPLPRMIKSHEGLSPEERKIMFILKQEIKEEKEEMKVVL